MLWITNVLYLCQYWILVDLMILKISLISLVVLLVISVLVTAGQLVLAKVKIYRWKLFKDWKRRMMLFVCMFDCWEFKIYLKHSLNGEGKFFTISGSTSKILVGIFYSRFISQLGCNWYLRYTNILKSTARAGCNKI